MIDREKEFIATLRYIVEHILSQDINAKDIKLLLHKLDADYIWDSGNLMITDCYFTIRHMWEETIFPEEWKYFLECFNNQRKYSLDDKFRFVEKSRKLFQE